MGISLHDEDIFRTDRPIHPLFPQMGGFVCCGAFLGGCIPYTLLPDGGKGKDFFRTFSLQHPRGKIRPFCRKRKEKHLAGGAQMQMAANYTLLSVASVVIGGTRLTGGSGGFVGGALGALVLILLTSILQALNMPPGVRYPCSGRHPSGHPHVQEPLAEFAGVMPRPTPFDSSSQAQTEGLKRGRAPRLRLRSADTPIETGGAADAERPVRRFERDPFEYAERQKTAGKQDHSRKFPQAQPLLNGANNPFCQGAFRPSRRPPEMAFSPPGETASERG
jgi:hypothetical protein